MTCDCQVNCNRISKQQLQYFFLFSWLKYEKNCSAKNAIIWETQTRLMVTYSKIHK